MSSVPPSNNDNNTIESYIIDDQIVEQTLNTRNRQVQRIKTQTPVRKSLDYSMTNEVYTQSAMDVDTADALQGASFSEDAKELRRLMRSYGVFDRVNMEYNTKCYRYPRADPYNFVDGAKEYVFITKVDLPILDSSGSNLASEVSFYPYINDLWRSGYIMPVFANLCMSIEPSVLSPATEANYPFMRILSNRKTSNLDLGDINVEELESPTNLFGSKVVYAKSSALSDENPEFSLEFEDTKYLEIYNLFKTYDLYRQGKWLGIFGPGLHAAAAAGSKVYSTYVSYIPNKILYDHMSVYKFLVASDGTTILHAAKFTGCFPKSISRSSLSELDEKGGLKITVNFKVSGWLTEDIVEIARDFNCIIYNYTNFNFMGDNRYAEPIYDTTIDRVSQEAADFPFIRKYPNEDMRFVPRDVGQFSHYYLLWGNNPSAPSSRV